MHDISQLICRLKTAIIKKEIYIYYNYTKNIKKILKFLIKHNYILKIKLKKTIGSNKKVIKFYKIWLPFLDNRLSITNIKVVSKPSHCMYLNYYSIESLIYKNSSKVFCFSTSKGLLTCKEMIKYKIGGKLLFYLEI